MQIAGFILLLISAALVIWQGSFSFGPFAPSSPEQTVLYWAISTLVFLLTVTLGFMLVRTAARLYVERRSNREGSRIKTKLVVGALALSILPVFFLLLWSVSVLNRNLDKWFSRPAENVRLNLLEVVQALEQERLQPGRLSPQWLEARQREIENYIREYDRLAISRKEARRFYLMLLAAITLFILFVATWVALFLARQISNPISALLDAAAQVRRGNLSHRVQVKAMDELATLVRAFNEMTRDLEASSRELEQRRRFTEAILEAIPSGVISVSADGRIQRVNRALGQIVGPEKAARAQRLEDLFPREDAAELRYMMKRARRTGQASRQFEFRTEQGRRQLSATVAALDDRIGTGFVVVIEDTSELLRAQKALAWQEVARRVAHEIKNPLTPISLSAERMALQLGRHNVPAEFRRIAEQCIQTITREVESVKNLVNEFSQLARFPAARLVPADLNEVVREALAVFEGRLDGIHLECELAPGLPPANLDRELFKRAIVNLVDNAAEAMQEAPLKRLYVATQAPSPEMLELVVADTGCGISPEDKEKLFLPYFSTKGRGTGLGLAIVSQILAEHRASIRVEDNDPAGARFIVEIPALEPAKPAQEAAR
ncbi:MAG: ATP-binding protein [Bryobacterales bacterium]|nr:ATP-binding protein [Bryobacteraceae bacterium]MDW8131487.1 ATP-binding protein [Bryobacterales bacterium]